MALEYLAAAGFCLDDDRWNAAAGNAVHAGINAADALCAHHRGVRAAGTDQSASGDLLVGTPDGQRYVGDLLVGTPDGQRCVEAYRRLVANKARAESDPAPASRAVAQRCVRWATVLVDAALANVEQA
ncbi:MAG: hypothetical protein H8E59_08120 [Actinobacteria bacterium]|nr:hypothetical protein [Actinomycetota bacterium]